MRRIWLVLRGRGRFRVFKWYSKYSSSGVTLSGFPCWDTQCSYCLILQQCQQSAHTLTPDFNPHYRFPTPSALSLSARPSSPLSLQLSVTFFLQEPILVLIWALNWEAVTHPYMHKHSLTPVWLLCGFELCTRHYRRLLLENEAQLRQRCITA